MAQIVGTLNNEKLFGTSENDNILGLQGNDIIYGRTGNDTLDGGTGSDSLIGELGDDTYIVDSTTDVVVEAINEGNDIVRAFINYTLGSNIERLVLVGINAINGTGNSLNNHITGNKLNNLLDGREGIDTMLGGAGNDTYIATWNDVIVESADAGIDTVMTIGDIFYTLNENIENLTLIDNSSIIYNPKANIGNALNNLIQGNSSHNIFEGREGNDTLVGAAGNDTLDGGTEADLLDGGVGDDYYLIDNADDIIIEQTNAGLDRVVVSFAGDQYILPANVEHLYLTESGPLIAIGNDSNNYFSGNSSNNIFYGKNGNDFFNPGAGDDIIYGEAGRDIVAASDGNDQIWGGEDNDTAMAGGAGNDTLIGGSGNDAYTGGTGADDFRFFTPDEGSDAIRDFSVIEGDIISVSAEGFGGGLVSGATLTAEQFILGSSAVNASDRFIYDQTTGALFFDIDGTGSNSQVQIANLTTFSGVIPTLSYSNIVVVS
ncbi:hypothetical protein NIES2119_25190 [[Phormidium ambiguum] IAM M-71]|uniref:Calcium-binding protein n=1 Tax=[Phormidium ambiguum] IAM M-71 TaxID=454136 RepID=A0A1U7I8C1_9CYAN|nr:calcium-binding protein [Phormidium ambiguum]OKH32724.1 hypothetical protein NIES2119_25190 [Phormidium ambiguum IAM M-71]